MSSKQTNIDDLYSSAIDLLKQLIAIPSFSKEENKTADCLENFLLQKNIKANRYLNNVWATNKNFDSSKQTNSGKTAINQLQCNWNYRR